MYEVRVKNHEVEFVIGTVKTHEDAMALISRCLKNRGVSLPYYRTWSKDIGKITTVDYGNHTEFFYVEMLNEE